MVDMVEMSDYAVPHTSNATLENIFSSNQGLDCEGMDEHITKQGDWDSGVGIINSSDGTCSVMYQVSHKLWDLHLSEVVTDIF